MLHDYELSFEPPAEGETANETSNSIEDYAAAAAEGAQAAAEGQQQQQPVAMLRPETLRRTLAAVGFEEGFEVRDFSDNIRPLLRLLYWLAIVPYLVGGLLGLLKYMPQTMIAVNGLRDQHLWRYASVRVTKPGKLVMESGKTK